MQLESGLYPGSYVPTGVSPASSQADEKVWEEGQWPKEFSDGAWSQDWYPYFSNTEQSTVSVLWSVGGISNELRFDAAGDTLQVVIDGVVQATTAALTFSRHQKLTITMDWASREITVAGATAGNGTTAIGGALSWPTTGVSLRCCGRFNNNGFEASGRYSDVRRVV